MLRLHRASRALGVALITASLLSGTLALATNAAEADPDASDIVLVLDLSGSILTDKPTRTAFAEAVAGIGDRIAETSDKLVAGDATVSIVLFATKAVDLKDCGNLGLRENAAAVAKLAACLQKVAGFYRKGVDPALTRQIGDDTNYVAAMERAAGHLPADSMRPAIIFFTDGRHEANGVPVGQVKPARDRLFGGRSPFALLPVGMGLAADDRPRLEAGLNDLRIVRDMAGCDGGAFEWPNVVFDSTEAAGQAVAVALQEVSCTFTVEPTPTPVPTPTPAPLAPVRSIQLAPADASIEVSWTPPTDTQATPVESYQARCRPSAGGDYAMSEAVSTGLTATVGGLANGVEYLCEVAADRGNGEPAWTTSGATATPFGPPPAPLKPAVAPIDEGARIAVSMPADAPVTGFTYQCSSDGGATWPVGKEVSGSTAIADVTGLTNGVEYVCRAAAANTSGLSAASPLSDVFKPCAGFADCNPLVLPLIGAMGVFVGIYLVAVVMRARAGRRVYVTAQVDHLVSISLGRGPKVGFNLIKRGPYRRVWKVLPAEDDKPDVSIRYAGGEKFVIVTPESKLKAEAGRVVTWTDGEGQKHEIVVRAYDKPPWDGLTRDPEDATTEEPAIRP